jgi:hypothetical protein
MTSTRASSYKIQEVYLIFCDRYPLSRESRSLSAMAQHLNAIRRNVTASRRALSWNV